MRKTTPLDSRSIDASPLVTMNIAIGGEGDAPAKRCGATMSVSDDMLDAFENIDLTSYKTGYTVIDNNFDSQTVVATPLSVSESSYAPVFIGVSEALATFINENSEDISKISIVKSDESVVDEGGWTDVVDGVIGILYPVDDENSTEICDSDWASLIIVVDGETTYTYPFDSSNAIAPKDITFTPAEQNDENT